MFLLFSYTCIKCDRMLFEMLKKMVLVLLSSRKENFSLI